MAIARAKVIGQSRMAVQQVTRHLRLYGQGDGVDSANLGIMELIEWAYDMGHGEEYPCPITPEWIKREIKW